MTNITIMIDTWIGITCILNRLVDLIGQKTKGFGGRDTCWN